MKFKIGQKVRIKNLPEEERQGYFIGWNKEMTLLVGQVGTISKTAMCGPNGLRGYLLTDIGWVWAEHWLMEPEDWAEHWLERPIEEQDMSGISI